MKKTTVCLTLFSLILLVAGSAQSQVLWRSAKTLKKGKLIAKGMAYSMDFSKKYDSAAEEWGDNSSDQSDKGLQLMFGYGLTDRIETHLHVPVAFKSITTTTVDESESSIGDVYLKTRIGITPWSKDKNGFLLTGALRFGTGNDDAAHKFCNTGDGTTDLGIGGIFSTKWFSKFRTHVKLNYWLNGKNEAKTNIGDEIKLILKLDRNLHKKFMPFMTYIYYDKLDGETEAGVDVAGKSRNYFQVGGVYKPVKGVFVRPKVAFHFGGENGVMFSYKPMFDFWYVF